MPRCPATCRKSWWRLTKRNGKKKTSKQQHEPTGRNLSRTGSDKIGDRGLREYAMGPEIRSFRRLRPGAYRERLSSATDHHPHPERPPPIRGFGGGTARDSRLPIELRPNPLKLAGRFECGPEHPHHHPIHQERLHRRGAGLRHLKTFKIDPPRKPHGFFLEIF